MAEERVTFSLRVRPESAERVRAVAARNDWSVATALRTVVAWGLERAEGKAAKSASVSELSRTDEAELRQWRLFAERTWVGGDPTRQVTPNIDMHGWTFMIYPQRDDNMEIA